MNKKIIGAVVVVGVAYLLYTNRDKLIAIFAPKNGADPQDVKIPTMVQ